MLLTHKQDARTSSTDLKYWRRISKQQNWLKHLQYYLENTKEINTDIKYRDAFSRKNEKIGSSTETAEKTRKFRGEWENISTVNSFEIVAKKQEKEIYFAFSIKESYDNYNNNFNLD